MNETRLTVIRNHLSLPSLAKTESPPRGMDVDTVIRALTKAAMVAWMKIVICIC